MFQTFFHSAFHVCFHSLVPSALVLTADFLSLQVSSLFAMNVKIGCQRKLNSKAFNIVFLSATSLLFLSLHFHYSLLFCFVCHFPNQKSGKKRKKYLKFYSHILLASLGWLGRIVLFYQTDKQHKNCIHTATAKAEEYFEATTCKDFFSSSGFFKVVFIQHFLWYLKVQKDQLLLVNQKE